MINSSFAFQPGGSKELFISLSVHLDHYQVLQLYMAMGGVPHHLRNVEHRTECRLKTSGK
jgi:hypothetical protein